MKPNGPPEDAGGYSGFADVLEGRLESAHEDHKAMRRSVDRKFGPERFDLDATNKTIARSLLPDRRAAEACGASRCSPSFFLTCSRVCESNLRHSFNADSRKSRLIAHQG